jgi:hypothetical protein
MESRLGPEEILRGRATVHLVSDRDIGLGYADVRLYSLLVGVLRLLE